VSAFDDLVQRADRAVHGHLGGETVTYRPEFGAPVDVTGVFDAQYVLVKGGAEAGVEAVGPAVFLRLEDLPTDPEDDEPTLVIRALEYRVIERRLAGIGGVVLALRLVT
jgi:hypothetical protein